MDGALHIIGRLLLIDLAAAFLLICLVAMLGQRGRTRISLKMFLGTMVFLSICSSLIYGGLWLILNRATLGGTSG